MRVAMGVWAMVCASALGVCGAGPPAQGRVDDLRAGVPSVRAQAAIAMGRAGDRSAVPALIEALKDRERAVRREAAKALGFLKDARAVAPLLEALRDRDTNVRLYAAYALGEIKHPKAATGLLDALRDPAWGVRDQAAWALRELRDPALAKPLVGALTRDDADVAHTVWLLRHLEGRHAVGPLARLLEAPEAATRRRAVQALAELKLKEAAEPLLAALKDRDPEVRRRAIAALVELGDERAEKPIQALAASDGDPAVREAARQAVLVFSRQGDLAAHWSFDDRNPKVARDVTGRGSDGQIQGCTPVKGKVGHALAFGKDKYIELGKPPELPIASKPFTVMAWAKATAPHGVVIARGGAACGYSLYVKDGVAKFGIRRSGDHPAHIAAGKEQVVGAWVHLAGVVKADRIEVYVNGKLAATAKTPGYVPGNCGQGMAIGYDPGNSPAEIIDHFEGVLDEVKFYQVALSAKDIARQCAAKD